MRVRAPLIEAVPNTSKVVSGVESGLYKSLKGVLDEGVVALGAAFLLFILPVNWKKRTFAISWEQAVGIDWGTILLFGGGLSLISQPGKGSKVTLFFALQQITAGTPEAFHG